MNAPGVAGGITTSQSPPFSVPVRYMLLGILGFATFAVDLALQSAHLSQVSVMAPYGVALTHLLTLGSLLAFVMGAVYQLSTVAFLIPIRAVVVARWNFWLYAVGVAGLVASMAKWSAIGLAVFGSITTLSIYLYAIVVIVSVVRTSVRGPMQGFVLSAHAYLILAVTDALLMVLSFSVPALAPIEGKLLLTHIVLAMGGFFTFLIMGFSFKLLPMFTLSHGYATWRQKWTLYASHVALWSLVAGIWTDARWLLGAGGAFGVFALVNQWFDLRGIVKKRMRKRVEPPMHAVVYAVVAGGLALLLLLLQVFLARGTTTWQSTVTFYLLGFVALTVMGYSYKIVPFLVWTERYSKKRVGGKSVIISDLINLNHALPVLVGFAVGFAVLAVSAAASFGIGLIVGAVATSLAVLAYAVQITIVMEPNKLGRELLERD